MTEDDGDGHQAKLAAGPTPTCEETPRCIMAYADKALVSLVYRVTGSGCRSRPGGQPDHLLLPTPTVGRGGQILPKKAEKGHARRSAPSGLELTTRFLDRAETIRRGHRLRLALQPVERREEGSERNHSGLRVLLRPPHNGKWDLSFYTSAITNWNRVSATAPDGGGGSRLYRETCR